MIGILAGMGPRSTGPFIDKVTDKCQTMYGAANDIDYPHMMIYSCPTPFYIDQPIDHSEMEKAIIHGIRKLEQTGVDFIAMPCNTAHIYFNQLQQSASVPLLNMIDETIKKIPENSKKIALLATEPTMQSGMFQDAFLKHGFEYVHKDHWQSDVNQILSNIKKGNTHESRQLWESFSSELAETIDAAVIACTDLNIVTDTGKKNISFIDSSACLAEAVVYKYLSLTGHC